VQELRLKIGLIGCGRWGRNHARTLAALGVLGAVADERPEARDAFAAEFGCPAMSPDAMLTQVDIAAVVVVLPPDRQAQMALQVLQAGKHALIEKPMALDVAAAQAIVAAAKAAKVTAMTGHLLLFHPAYLAIEGLVRQGALGDIRHIRSERAAWGSFFPATDAAWDLLPHDLSLVLGLLGYLPAERRMQAQDFLGGRDDVASLTLREPGLLVDCFVSRVAPVRSRYLLVQGTKASAIWNDLEPDWGKKLVLVAHEGQVQGTPRAVPLIETMALEQELRHFLHCIATGDTPRGDVAGALQIIDAIATAPRA